MDADKPLTRPSIFISYVEEDESIAAAIARGMEAAGYETWYFTRDSLPGPSYLIQTGNAIDKAAAVVLVASQSSLGSAQVSAEVARAYECGRPIMPVLVGITHTELQQREPLWRQALGTAASIRIPSGDVGAILARLVRGAEALLVATGTGSLAVGQAPPTLENQGRRPIRGAAIALGHVPGPAPEVSVISDADRSVRPDAIVREEDTFLVLRSEPNLVVPTEHRLRVLHAAHEQEPLSPGSVIVRSSHPVELLAIVYDLSSEPICREEWVENALSSALQETTQRGLRSLALPLLGTAHGRLDTRRVATLTARVLATRTTYPDQVWITVPPGALASVKAFLQG